MPEAATAPATAPFRVANPEDNPIDKDGRTARDREMERKGLVPKERPFGVAGVDKPHGGGTQALEDMAADRRPTPPELKPAPNPNNPDSPNNPASAVAQAAERAKVPPKPVTTKPTPMKPAKGKAKPAAKAKAKKPATSRG